MAQAVARLPTLDPRLIWATLALIATLLLGALVIWWVDRWRKRYTQEKESVNDQLAHFRELFEQGTINLEEYERIRGLLGQRLREELDVANAPTVDGGARANPKPAVSPDPQEKPKGPATAG